MLPQHHVSSSSIDSTTLGGSWSVQQFYSTPVCPLPSPSNQQFSSSLGLLLPGPSTLTCESPCWSCFIWLPFCYFSGSSIKLIKYWDKFATLFTLCCGLSLQYRLRCTRENLASNIHCSAQEGFYVVVWEIAQTCHHDPNIIIYLKRINYITVKLRISMESVGSIASFKCYGTDQIIFAKVIRNWGYLSYQILVVAHSIFLCTGSLYLSPHVYCFMKPLMLFYR